MSHLVLVLPLSLLTDEIEPGKVPSLALFPVVGWKYDGDMIETGSPSGMDSRVVAGFVGRVAMLVGPSISECTNTRQASSTIAWEGSD